MVGLCGLAGVLSGCACLGRGAAARELFNGRDLTNWYTFIRGRGVNCDPKGVFTVTNGVIHVSGEEFGCLTTCEEFSERLDGYIEWYRSEKLKKSLGWKTIRQHRVELGYAA